MSQYQQIPELGLERVNGSLKLTVENIKCGGCANTITKALNELHLKDIQVDHENNLITFKDPTDDVKVITTLNKLRSLGYPLVDSEEGLTAMALKAKSYASCAIGKITK